MDYNTVYHESKETFYKKVFSEARGAFKTTVNAKITKDNVKDLFYKKDDKDPKKFITHDYDPETNKLRLTLPVIDDDGNYQAGKGTILDLGLQGYIGAMIKGGKEAAQNEDMLDEYIDEESIYSDTDVEHGLNTHTSNSGVTRYQKKVDFIYDLADDNLANDGAKARKVSSNNEYSNENSFNVSNKDYVLTASNNIRYLCAYCLGDTEFTYKLLGGSTKKVDVSKLGLRKVNSDGTTEKVKISQDAIKAYLFVQALPKTISTMLNYFTTSKGKNTEYAVERKLLSIVGNADANDIENRLDALLTLIDPYGNDKDDKDSIDNYKFIGLYYSWTRSSDTMLRSIVNDETSSGKKLVNYIGYIAKNIHNSNSNINRYSIDKLNTKYNYKGVACTGSDILYMIKKRLGIDPNNEHLDKNTQDMIEDLFERATTSDKVLEARFLGAVRNSKLINDMENVSLDSMAVDDSTLDPRIESQENDTAVHQDVSNGYMTKREGSPFDSATIDSLFTEMTKVINNGTSVVDEKIDDEDVYDFLINKTNLNEVKSIFSYITNTLDNNEHIDSTKLNNNHGLNNLEIDSFEKYYKDNSSAIKSIKLDLNSMKIAYYDSTIKNSMMRLLLRMVMGSYGLFINNKGSIPFTLISSVNKIVYGAKSPFIEALYIILKHPESYISVMKNSNSTSKVRKYSINFKEALIDLYLIPKSVSTASNGKTTLIKFDNIKNNTKSVGVFSSLGGTLSYPIIGQTKFNNDFGKALDESITETDLLAAGLLSTEYKEDVDMLIESVEAKIKNDDNIDPKSLENAYIDNNTKSDIEYDESRYSNIYSMTHFNY